MDNAALSGGHDLTITEFTAREYYHYPLAVQAQPGRELGLHVQFRTDIFDLASIEALIERLQRIFLTMVADPAQRLSSFDLVHAAEHDRLEQIYNRGISIQPVTSSRRHPNTPTT